MTDEGRDVAITGDAEVSTTAACQNGGFRYNPSAGIDLHALALIGTENSCKSFEINNLGPSTQVGYGEVSKTPGNLGGFEGVDHQLDHGNKALLVYDDLRAVVDAWPYLPVEVRKMIVGVVKLTPKVENS